MGPVSAAERIQALDVIRGFALLGILLMNIEYFQRPMQAVMFGLDTTLTGADAAAAWFSFTFIQGKFYTMFSLLFGVGFVIFLDRAMARGGSPRLLFARRLAGLMLIGAAHAFLVWSGDILLMYGLVGFVLLMFARKSARGLARWGIGFYLFPVVLIWLAAFAITAGLNSPAGAEMLADSATARARILAEIAQGDIVYATGSYAQAVSWRVHEYMSLYGGGGILFFTPTVVGLFLIGAAFGRAGVFANLAAHRGLFRRMVVGGYAIGIPAAMYWTSVNPDANVMLPDVDTALGITVNAIACIALCLAYVGTLALLLQRPASQRVLAHLAPAGRLALTNYLTHSVVFTLLFYGYGLGLYGEYGRAATMVMALALYGFQLWFSAWWLQRKSIGPMEALWRRMTYGRVATAT